MKDIIENESSEGITSICAHDIAWRFDKPNMSLAENDEEHIQKKLIEGYKSGELCSWCEETQEDVYGWWSIEPAGIMY